MWPDTRPFSAADAHPLAAAGFDHFCLVVQEHDIEGVRQQLAAAAGIEAEAQFDGVVVKRFGAQGNASSIYIRDPGACLRGCLVTYRLCRKCSQWLRGSAVVLAAVRGAGQRQ